MSCFPRWLRYMAECRREDKIWLQCLSCFLNRWRSGRWLWKMVASLPKPQRWKKLVARSNPTLQTLSPYSCFFSNSCLQRGLGLTITWCIGMEGYTYIACVMLAVRVKGKELSYFQMLMVLNLLLLSKVWYSLSSNSWSVFISVCSLESFIFSHLVHKMRMFKSVLKQLLLF